MGAFRAAEEAILAILGDEGAIPKRAALLISRQLSLISAEFALMANEVTVLKKSKVAYAANIERVSYAAAAKQAMAVRQPEPAKQPKVAAKPMAKKVDAAK